MKRVTRSVGKAIGIFLFSVAMSLVLLPFGAARANQNDPAAQYGYAVTRNDPVQFRSTNGNERLELKLKADIERSSAPTVHYDAQVKSNYMCDWSYDKVLGRYVCEKNYLRAYEYVHPKPIPVCPFGYKLNYGRSNCVKITFPQNAHLNSRGDGWECNPGYHLSPTGSVCQGSENIYRQCPGGSFNCGSSGCASSGCAGNCAVQTQVQPIVAATPVVVQPIVNVAVYNQASGNQSKTPSQLPQTGPAGLVTLALGSAGAGWCWVRKRFLA